jgi:hypothetical protein
MRFEACKDSWSVYSQARVTDSEAASSLKITCRQLRRLKSKSCAQEGKEELIHGNIEHKALYA